MPRPGRADLRRSAQRRRLPRQRRRLRTVRRIWCLPAACARARAGTLSGRRGETRLNSPWLCRPGAADDRLHAGDDGWWLRFEPFHSRSELAAQLFRHTRAGPLRDRPSGACSRPPRRHRHAARSCPRSPRQATRHLGGGYYDRTLQSVVRAESGVEDHCFVRAWPTTFRVSRSLPANVRGSCTDGCGDHGDKTDKVSSLIDSR